MAPRSDCTHAATVSGPLEPAPIEAAHDLGPAWNPKDCFAKVPSFTTVSCTFGPKSGHVRVALIGNSHAGQWGAAMQAIAKARGWQVTTFLSYECAVNTVLQQFTNVAADRACHRWVQRTVNAVTRGHFDLVVMSDRVSVAAVGKTRPESLPAYRRGYEAVLRRLAAANEQVVEIRDTPHPTISVPQCLAENSTDYLHCRGSRAKWLPADPVVKAVKTLHTGRVRLADLTTYICGPTHCPAAIGRVPIYFDDSHMTATYARTLAPYLKPFLTKALSG
jgi:hypothetical protein